MHSDPKFSLNIAPLERSIDTLSHGLLYTRTEDSRPFFSKSEPAGISKNGRNIICTSLKNKHFLFYAQECGAKFKPAIPF